MTTNQVKIVEFLKEYIEVLKLQQWEYTRDNLLARAGRVQEKIDEVNKTMSIYIFDSTLHHCCYHQSMPAPASFLPIHEVTFSYKNLH